MTQEEKELLLVDLCSRLPYGVKVRRIVHTTDVDTIESVELFGLGWLEEFYAGEAEFFPYLRPMSSMTEEERKEENRLWNIITKTRNDLHYLYTDFLLSHHFDYRGLIPMGLALKAPEGMYE